MEKIAKAIGSAISNEAKVVDLIEVNSAELKPIGFIIVGSPPWRQADISNYGSFNFGLEIDL